MKIRALAILGVAVTAGALLAARAAPAEANHSWGNYHWGRSADSFTLQLGDNVNSSWDSFLATASSDWTKSAEVHTTVVSGKGGNSCKAQSGRVEVCNRSYGWNGWLGLAGIYVSGSHITKAYVKMNDTYFNTATYNTRVWRGMVMCQEVGHTFGLDHQDENFNNPNLGTCMDYTNDPSGTAGTNGDKSNEHPNQHDYDQLVTIYNSHTDSSTTVASSLAAGAAAADAAGNSQADWGQAIRYDSEGRPILFERHLGNGVRLFTWVRWATLGGPGVPRP